MSHGNIRTTLFCAAAFAVLFLAVLRPAHADDEGGRFTLQEENDCFASHDDRHYTQGLRVTWLSSPVTANDAGDRPYNWLGDSLPVFSGSDRTRKYEATIIGQSIFTPTNTLSAVPSPKDRPYAAWLYTGAGLLQDTDHGSYHTLENAELLIGIVGPEALGAATQNDWHQFIGVTSVTGWNNQLHTEPGVILTYERKWRFEQPLISNFAADVIPEAGVSAGNILTYGEVGGMVRVGQNLRADYGPDRMRPSLSGTGWFDANQLDGDLGWYVFLGTQGRAVARNIFLQGNTFSSGPHVEERPLVADFIGGASLFWSTAVRADFTVTRRTYEFYGQRSHPDQFGGVNLVVGF